jgi:hypothetical protein
MTFIEANDPVAKAMENAREKARLDALERLRARPIAELESAITGERLRGTAPFIVMQCCADIALDAIMQATKGVRPDQREAAMLTMLEGVANGARDYLDTQDQIDVVADLHKGRAS